MGKFPFKNVFVLMQKCLSASTTTIPVAASASSPLPFTVEYLVSSCRVPLESAIAASQRIQLKEENIQKYDSVLDLLRSHGFDHTHIAAITEKRPNILTDYTVDKNLKPKLEYLVQNGFSGCHLHDLIVSDPNILGKSLSSAIKPSLEYLRSILGTEERVLLSVKRHSRLLKNNLEGALQSNMDIFLKEGVPLDAITKFFIVYPYLMIPSVPRLVSALEAVKDILCIHPSSPVFLVAVTRIASFGVPGLEKKIQVFKSFGFSHEDAFCIFRRYPLCFSRSEETLRTKLEFYLGIVKLKHSNIISCPNLLSYAIETRSRPRHNVLKLLLSKKLLKEDAKLLHILTMSEDKFLKKYITSHLQQVPSLLEMYTNDKLAT